jgi:hypothetical protein
MTSGRRKVWFPSLNPSGQGRNDLRRGSRRDLKRRSLIRFWLWRRSATGNSADRSGHLSTDVVTSALKHTDLRSDPARQARELFDLGLVHALEYGVASADLKPSTVWARTRLTLSA